MAFNLDNYEEVKDRIPLFYLTYPEGRITTEIVLETVLLLPAMRRSGPVAV